MRRRTARPSRALRVLDEVGAFLFTEVAGGVVLLAATAVALVWANSAAAGAYDALWQTIISLQVGDVPIVSLDLRHWVNDLLMALFFFVVGLEIKREMVAGELADPRKRLLPVAAALGGMTAPALIYLALNAGGQGAAGWGIPMATDIAFAIGALALFGDRVPYGLRLLLLSVAIVDDIGAILVIAIFYTGDLQLLPLALAALSFAGVVLLWRLPFYWTDPPIVLLMVATWAATFASGMHATIAGVALGLAAPARGVHPTPAERLEKTLHPYTSFLVVPLFALANAGIALDVGSIADALASPVALGVAIGLVVGKTLGVTGGAWLAVRSGLASLPAAVGWRHVLAVAAIAGIGFTVSLFITSIAFGDEGLARDAKLGILGGSLVAALIGSAILLLSLQRASAPKAQPRRE